MPEASVCFHVESPETSIVAAILHWKKRFVPAIDYLLSTDSEDLSNRVDVIDAKPRDAKFPIRIGVGPNCVGPADEAKISTKFPMLYRSRTIVPLLQDSGNVCVGLGLRESTTNTSEIVSEQSMSVSFLCPK